MLRFREVVGATPMAYLTARRMAIVQVILRRGEPLKSIAPVVGLREFSGVEPGLYAVDRAVAHQVDRSYPVQRGAMRTVPRTTDAKPRGNSEEGPCRASAERHIRIGLPHEEARSKLAIKGSE
jgi:hypothetical protein